MKSLSWENSKHKWIAWVLYLGLGVLGVFLDFSLPWGKTVFYGIYLGLLIIGITSYPRVVEKDVPVQLSNDLPALPQDIPDISKGLHFSYKEKPEKLLGTMTPETLRENMWKECSYVCSDEEAFTMYMALELGKPLLVEGPPGSGKTEVAKVMAAVLNADLIRLQCYEGLDEGKALYEWNYQKQILDIQKGEKENVFGASYLLPRPLLSAIQARKTPVLLIDEIDKVDPEFEAYLMEILSDFQVSIPEFGTVKAKTHPPVILTSNAVRDLGDALRRRCVYLYLDFPTMNREATILMRKVVGIRPSLALQIARTMYLLRTDLELLKQPSISESLDLAQAAISMKKLNLDPMFLDQLSSLFLKTREDQEQFSKKGGGKWVCKNL